MATYVNDLRLKEIATGDEAGTWGTSTNTNLELIAEAFSFGTEAITTNADTHTTTIADGSTDPGRSIFLKYTGTLDSACTITIGPNTVSKLWLIENATSGSQAIIIKQGSGATITVPNGQTKAIYSDGAGSGGAMVDAFQDLSIPDLFIDDDLTFTSDSAVITFGADGDTTLTHTDGSGLTLNSTNKIMFNDASQFIQGSSATVLSLGATDEIDLTATAIDVNGTIDVSGNATLGGTVGVTGVLTANAGVVVDNITIDGTEIDLSSGDLTIDVAGDIKLDAGGNDWIFLNGGTAIGRIINSSSDFVIQADVADKDIIFKGDDGGSAITALTLDMSAAGIATFNSGINIGNRGSASDPTLQSSIDPDTGVFWGGSNILGFSSGGVERLRVSSEVVVNEPSNDVDFRVESNGNTHALFVDAGNDHVNIGTSTDLGGLLNVGGSIFAKTTSAGTAVKIESSEAGASAGPGLVLYRSSASAADSDLLGNLTFEAKNDAAQDVVYSQIFAQIADASDGTEDGILNFKTILAGTEVRRIDLGATETVFNEDSKDLDFRVESDSNTHMLFVDAGNNRVGIAESSPGVPLHVKDSGTYIAGIESTSAYAYLGLRDSNSGGSMSDPTVGVGAQTNDLAFRAGGSERARIDSSGNLGLGTTTIDQHLHVEGAGTQAIKVETTADDYAIMQYKTSTSSLWQSFASPTNDYRIGISGTGDAITIDSSLNVGIGTTSPANLLHLKDEGYQLKIEDTSSGNTGEVLVSDTSLYFFSDRSNAKASSDIRFSVDNSEAMLIDSSGNVGIGTSSPVALKSSTTLQVSGNAKLGDDNARGLLSLGDITSTGANAGIWRGAAGAYAGTGNYLNLGGYDGITFTTGNADISSQTEAMRLDSSGNLGLGTDSPSSKLHLSASSEVVARLTRSAGTNALVLFQDPSSTTAPYIGSYGNSMAFGRYAGGESMRIDANGNLLIGSSTSTPEAQLVVDNGGNQYPIWLLNSSSSIDYPNRVKSAYATGGQTASMFSFLNTSNTTVGTIKSTASSTSFNTSSDYRLKENIVPLTGATERVKQLNPTRFNFIVNPNVTVDGFLAHEVQDIVPEAIAGEKDEVDADGNAVYQGIDQSKLVPLLVATIQECCYHPKTRLYLGLLKIVAWDQKQNLCFLC